MLVYCDTGPTFSQHWFNAPCLLGMWNDFYRSPSTTRSWRLVYSIITQCFYNIQRFNNYIAQVVIRTSHLNFSFCCGPILVMSRLGCNYIIISTIMYYEDEDVFSFFFSAATFASSSSYFVIKTCTSDAGRTLILVLPSSRVSVDISTVIRRCQ